MTDRPNANTLHNVQIEINQDGVDPENSTTNTAVTIQNPITPPPSYSLNDNPHGIINVTESHGSNPPSYEDAIDPNAPPPSYDSLYGRVRGVHKSSNNVFDFLKNFVVLILGTLGCSILIGITIVVPIAMIFIGIVYRNECPRSEHIPAFLIVGGSLAMINQCLDLYLRATKKNQPASEVLERKSKLAALQSSLNCFLIIWFFAGSIVIYQAYEPSYNPSSARYCNRTLYLFAFWLHTSFYILAAMTTCCLCSVVLVTIALADEK